MLPAEQAAPLKLLEKGVSKEALAGLVLLEFPCELASAVLAGRWASSPTPFTPFMMGYKIRLVMAAAVTLVVSDTAAVSLSVCLSVCVCERVCLPACVPSRYLFSIARYGSTSCHTVLHSTNLTDWTLQTHAFLREG